MEREIAYNLWHHFEEFKEKIQKKEFYFQDIGGNYYEIRKKITHPTRNYPHEFVIVGNIFNKQFLIIYSALSPLDKKDIRKKQAISQLEKIADNFLV